LFNSVGLGVSRFFDSVSLFVQRLFHRLIVGLARLLFQSVGAGFAGVFDRVGLIFSGGVGRAFTGGERASQSEGGDGGEGAADLHWSTPGPAPAAVREITRT
jgi:hypothetical protein